MDFRGRPYRNPIFKIIPLERRESFDPIIKKYHAIYWLGVNWCVDCHWLSKLKFEFYRKGEIKNERT
jgi:hypothetical protein